MRAIPAVLYVGDVMVNDCKQLARVLYVFRAFNPEQLMAGTRISLSWPNHPTRSRLTGFRYEPPEV